VSLVLSSFFLSFLLLTLLSLLLPLSLYRISEILLQQATQEKSPAIHHHPLAHPRKNQALHVFPHPCYPIGKRKPFTSEQYPDSYIIFEGTGDHHQCAALAFTLL
jgi:hypothetical protein